MKPETIRLLEKWRSEIVKPIQGIVVSRDYNPCEDGTIELMWTADYQREGVNHTFFYREGNILDDVSAINVKIDVIEQVELKKYL